MAVAAEDGAVVGVLVDCSEFADQLSIFTALKINNNFNQTFY